MHCETPKSSFCILCVLSRLKPVSGFSCFEKGIFPEPFLRLSSWPAVGTRLKGPIETAVERLVKRKPSKLLVYDPYQSSVGDGGAWFDPGASVEVHHTNSGDSTTGSTVAS